jgi:ubiquinone/menaquinone biosynthesis C-methylase UbiE
MQVWNESSLRVAARFVRPRLDPSSRMNKFSPSRQFDPNCPELIDQPDVTEPQLREELKALENMNRQFGGHRLMLEFMDRLLNSMPETSLRILDLATGAADIPRILAAWFRERRRPVAITAVDRNPHVLRYARESCRDWPEIQFEQHDLRELPYAPDSYDLVLCSLALHHFSSADAIVILRRMQGIARGAYVVNDLRRNYLAILSTELLARTVITNPNIRHDAVQSARAAFTVHELQAMGEQAGLKNFRIRRRQLFFHMVLEGKK